MRNSAIRVINALWQNEIIEARRSGSQSVDEPAGCSQSVETEVILSVTVVFLIHSDVTLVEIC